MFKFPYAFILFLLLTACADREQTQKVTDSEKKFELSIPASMQATEDLNADASLQYQNPSDELYVIVLQDSKEEFVKSLEENNLDTYSPDLRGFTQLIRENYETSLDSPRFSVPEEVKINGNKAVVFNMFGTVDNFDVTYMVAFIEGKTTYYQLLTWTMSSRLGAEKAHMENMINSFREL